MTHMQPYELDAWLGDTELTAEQRTTLEDAIDHLTSRYADDGDAVGEGMSGALMVIVGDDTLEGVAGEWARARAAERDAMARLTGAIIASAVQGQPETTIAERAGVNRLTVRKALGKYGRRNAPPTRARSSGRRGAIPQSYAWQ